MDFQAALGGDDYYSELEKRLKTAHSKPELYSAIVNAPFFNRRSTALLGLGIVVFLRVNKAEGMIDRLAVSDNEMTLGTFKMTAKPFHEIKIPVDYTQNFIAKAIREQHYMITADWQYLFIPALTPEQARFNQAGGGIACSVVYPLSNIKDRGAMIFSFYEQIERIGHDHHNFMTRYTSLAQRVLNDFESGG